MFDSHTPQLNLRSAIALLLRHKKKVVVFPLFALGLGAAVLLFFPRTYHSEARLFLRVGRETVGLDPTATTGQTMGMSPMDRKDEMKSAVDVLTSRGVIAMVVDDLGPEVVLGLNEPAAAPENPWVAKLREPADKLLAAIESLDPISDRERATILVERQLSVHAERESNVISVWVEAKTPTLAQKICQSLVAAYQQEHMRIYRNEESRPFFAQQHDRLRVQLDDALSAVRAAKNEMGFASVDERRITLEAQFSAIELEKFNTQQQLATAKARVADLEKQLASLPERLVASQKSVPNQGADLMRDQLYALEMKAMDLEARYSDEHPLVQAVHLQLEDARKIVSGQSNQRVETTDSVNPLHRELSLDLKREKSLLAGLEARLTEVAEQKSIVLADLRSANEFEVKIDQLQREADLARGKYFQYAQNLEEARIDKELEAENISNVSVLQAPTFAEKPVSPSRLLVIAGTLLLATAGTASLVLGSEMLHEHNAKALNGSNGTFDSEAFQRALRTSAASSTANGNGNGKSQPLQPAHTPQQHDIVSSETRS
jgi:uncharacterized protein involved in exopolysaccharide biosynthesis